MSRFRLKKAKAAPFDPKWLRNDYNELISSIQLSDEQRHFLRSRWLEYVLWMEVAAQRARNYYYVLRLTTVVGAVVIPALVSNNAIWVSFGLSLAVALSAAVEAFFQFGARWRHYRSLVEDLKAEGWAFYELGGPYGTENATHSTGFQTFVDRVNDLLTRETRTYISEIATPKTVDKTTAKGT
ncbi:MAG: DUF4231 domain-containing protein [Gaiellales bacterium]